MHLSKNASFAHILLFTYAHGMALYRYLSIEPTILTFLTNAVTSLTWLLYFYFF